MRRRERELFDTRDAAVAQLDEWVRLRQSSQHPAGSWLDEWLGSKDFAALAATTRVRYAQLVDARIRGPLGRYRLGELTPKVLVAAIMPRMITTCLALLLVIASGTRTAAPTGSPAATVVETRAQADSLTGTWALTVTTSQGTGSPTVTLKQDGGKLSGTYSSQVFGEQPVTGSVTGSEFTFTFTGDIQGTSLVVTYTGTVEKDSMKGKVTLGDMGEGTFTGSRK